MGLCPRSHQKMPCGYRKNPELGFIPLALAAAPVAGKLVGGVGKALGGLFKKKKKKAAPAPAAGSKASASTSATRAGSPSVHAGSKGRKKAKKPTTIVATSDKPTLTKADLAAALSDYHKARQTTKQARSELAAQLKSTVAPQIATISKLAKEADLRAQVTSEHNRRMKESARWDASTEAHKKIIAKIDQLEKSLLADRARKLRAFDIYGVHA